MFAKVAASLIRLERNGSVQARFSFSATRHDCSTLSILSVASGTSPGPGPGAGGDLVYMQTTLTFSKPVQRDE